MISNIKQHRKNIKTIFQQSLNLNSSTHLVQDYVLKLYRHSDDIHVVALGKTASAMLDGAILALGTKFSRALLVTKNQPDSMTQLNQDSIQIIKSGHPIPDENSLFAGEKLIDFLQSLKTHEHVLFLISGGTSALVEYFPASMPGIISINELIKLNTWLLASDRNIMDVNQIRKKISGIKGGRLVNYINSDNIKALYISDVPDDELKNIGSGLLIQEDVTLEVNNLPAWINELINRSKKIPVPRVKGEKKITSHIVFSNSLLRKSLLGVAKNFKYDAQIMDDFLIGNTTDEAIKVTSWLKNQKSGLYIWGAETHMALPAKPGRGGRNQSFALVVARELQNSPNIVVLIAGTDGNDGNTTDAGAIVDGRTINRGVLNNASMASCLANANAGEFLSASGDLLTLTATGTNVMDIIMAIIWD